MHLLEVCIDKGNYSGAYAILVQLANEIGPKQYSQLDNKLSKLVNKNKLYPVQTKTSWKYEDREKLILQCLDDGFVQKYRFRGGSRHVKIVCEENTIVNLNWHYYKYMLMKAKKTYLIKRYNIEERLSSYVVAKNMSTFFLTHGPSISVDYRFIVGIDTLYGFNLKTKGLSSLKEIREWVSKPFRPQYKMSESLYLKKFETAVRDVLLHHNPTKSQASYTINEFVTNVAAQSTAGASYDPGNNQYCEFEIDGQVYKGEKNKFNKSGALSYDQKYKRLFAYSKATHKVDDKIEVYPKRRLIVSADYNITLKMTCIYNCWFGDFLKGNDLSQLWRTKKQVRDMWLQFSNYETKRWRLPIDQSAFDHHVSKEMVLIVISVMRSIIREYCIDDGTIVNEFIEIMNTIYYGLENGEIHYELRPDDVGYVAGKRTIIVIQYNNGVLSGWRWTSLINSICNSAEMYVARTELKEDGVIIQIQLFDATGDDQLTEWKTLIEPLMYWLALAKSGFDIHPDKNYFSTHHNEYLRISSDSSGMSGYPARLVERILWVYPGNTSAPDILTKMNDIYDRWEKICLRMRIKLSNVEKEILEDMSNAKFGRDIIDAYLYGHRIFGGKQLSERYISDKILHYQPGTWKYHTYVHGAGYSKFVEIFGRDQKSEMTEWFTSVCKVIEKNNLEIEDRKLTVDIAEKIEPKEFALVDTVTRIPKPTLRKGWHMNTIFTTNDDVMNEAFTNIPAYITTYSAPKSWIYDWATGRITVHYPRSDTMSQAAMKLFSIDFEHSLISSMLRKKMRGVSNKWLSLQKYYVNNITDRVRRVIGSQYFVF